ncbi:helix-turn-helix domain-containing protein [Nostoc sp. KVJ3]|uniref:helix-turn-helix domain-containing protein n=1 Tax=Nostoc sp. KVJ3 TaxID=457945 RepID=UPI0022380D1E|nr:helix-turn-helix domain-containing protein [Nostoc sp. KVJ3]MCW5317917.1 helix-turn-helix domain-containing protein [Nostoc sp. KVJ3]
MSTDKTIQRAFELYKQGYSLRSLAKIFKISKTNLGKKFTKAYGRGYAELKNKYGLTPVIKEYLNDGSLSTRQKEQISDWFSANRKVIAESDSKYLNSPILTNSREQQLTYLECSHKSKDWKDLITDCWVSP